MVQHGRPRTLLRWRRADRWGRSPAEPPTPTGCAASTAGSPGRRRGVSAVPPRRRSWSTSATAPPPSRRWNCTTGCAGSARRAGRRRRDRPRARGGGPCPGAARPLVPPRRLRGSSREPGQAEHRAGLQRAAAVRRGRGRRRLGPGAGPPRRRRTAGRRHLRRARPTQHLDRRGPLRTAVADPVLAAARSGLTLRDRRATAEVAHPPERRGGACARLPDGARPCLAACRTPRDVRGAPALPGGRRLVAGGGLAAAGRPGPVAPRRGDRRLGRGRAAVLGQGPGGPGWPQRA